MDTAEMLWQSPGNVRELGPMKNSSGTHCVPVDNTFSRVHELLEMARWRDGGMAGWLDGWMARWLKKRRFVMTCVCGGRAQKKENMEEIKPAPITAIPFESNTLKRIKRFTQTDGGFNTVREKYGRLVLCGRRPVTVSRAFCFWRRIF